MSWCITCGERLSHASSMRNILRQVSATHNTKKKMKDKSKMRMYIRGAHKQLVPDMALLNHSCATHTRTYTCRTIQRIIKIETSIHVHMLEFDPSTIAGGHIKRK